MTNLHRDRARRGNALYSVASMMVIISFGALAVDIGHQRGTRAELQRAVDAGAHAGAAYLDGTDDGCDAALQAAVWYANANRVDGRSPAFTERDVTFARYEQGVLTTLGECNAKANTLRIQRTIDDVSTMLAPVAFGVHAMQVTARSTVMQPPPSAATEVSCFLPIAVPQCAITGPGTFNFRRSSNGEDTAGWASLVSGTTNAAFFKEQLSGNNCQGAKVSDNVLLQNGSVMAAEAVARDRINYRAHSSGVALEPPDPWPTEIWDSPDWSDRLSGSRIFDRYYGRYGIGGPVMLVAAGDRNMNGVDDLCDPSPPNFTGAMKMAGFAYGMIYDANSGDIAIEINTEERFDDEVIAGGGTNPYGMTFQEPPVLLE